MSDQTPDDDMPYDEVPLEALPLDSWHRVNGARMVPFAGYEMPIQYTGPNGGILVEHNWTRESASLFDVSHMGQLGLVGPDGDVAAAAAALEALVPGDISQLSEGRMRYSLLLNDAGGILDDLIITNTGKSIALVVNGEVKWDDIAHLREHLADEITLTHYADNALLALQGPKAAEVLEAMVPGTGALTFMTSGFFEWRTSNGDAVPLWVSRSGYTGEDGFEIAVAADHVEALANALIADERVNPAGLGARDSLRLEAGLPLYGHDLTEGTDPVAAGLKFALSKSRREIATDGTGWMGQEAVMKAFDDGPKQRRIGLTLEGRMPAREGAVIFNDEKAIGTVTSGGFSPTLGHPIAMGLVDETHLTAGDSLDIEVRGKRLPCIVSKMPFVSHKYYRGS